MTIIDDILSVALDLPRVVLTLGSYDGIHLGHRMILDGVVQHAKAIDGTPAVLTMRPHPREFFSPEHAPNLLTSESKKLRLFEELGLGAALVLRFDAAAAAMEPVEFIERVVCGQCHAVALIVGHDCRFGAGAKGDYELLERVSAQYGFTVRQVPALIVEGERVSSTLIRERLLQGDLKGAETLLGRKYSITGEVVKGRGLGSTIGFPTANVMPDHSAVPAQGVYIAEVLLEGVAHPAAVNIGIAPTLRHEDLCIEAHLIDFEGELVGKEIEIVFHARIRPEKKFPSVDDLVAQIGRDVDTSRDYFKGLG